MGSKPFFTILTTLILFCIILGVGISSASDASYSIPSINKEIFLQDDGTLHIKETIHYSFIGSSSVVYRDISTPDPVSLENIKIVTPGVYSNSEVIDGKSSKIIKINLYSNPSKTIPVSDRDVDVVVEYDLLHAIKFYNDVAELQYKLVGEEWSVNVNELNAQIHLSSNEGVNYFLNPQDYLSNSSWQGNTLVLSSKKIHTGRFFQIIMTIPKSQFISDPPNVVKVNQDIIPEFEKLQKDNQNQLSLRTVFYPFISILMLLACLIPVLIYLIYGRNPRIDYNAQYEKDIPINDPPAVVNAISGKLFGKEVGEPDMDGFRATIMDLISRNYLILESIPKEGVKDSNPISFRINEDKDSAELLSFERDIVDFFKYFEEKDGTIYLEKIKKGLTVIVFSGSDKVEDDKIISFQSTYNKWKDDLINDFLNGDVMSKFFQKRGEKFLRIFGSLGVLVALVIFIASIADPLPVAQYSLISSLFLLFVALTCLILPHKIAGHWTTYGEEYDAHWKNFTRYIHDYSLLNEYPPESIEMWDKYMVYACALGVAGKVKKSMELFPYDVGSKVYKFYYSGGYCDLSKSLDKGIDSIHKKSVSPLDKWGNR